VSDRHIRVLRGVAKRRRARASAERARGHASGSPGSVRRDDLERSSALADARLAAAEARRGRAAAR
jgi:hypothetical protein